MTKNYSTGLCRTGFGIFGYMAVLFICSLIISCGKSVTTGGAVYEALYYNQYSRDTMIAWYDRWLSKCRIPVREKYIRTSYGNIHLLEWGDSGKPVLVLIHGGMSNAAFWTDMVPHLVKDFHIIAPDVIGDPTGKTVPDTVPVTRTMYMKWLDELLDSLHTTGFFLAGHSLGGLITMDYARHNPGRLGKIAVLNPATGIHKMRFGAMFGFMTAMLFPGKNYYKESVDVMRSPGITTAEDCYEYFKTTMENCRLSFPMPWVLTKSELREIKVPMLLLVGSDEILYKAEDGIKRAGKFIPNLKARSIPRAGHLLIMDQPETTSRHLAEFLLQR